MNAMMMPSILAHQAMTARVYQNIDDVEPELWNSLTTPNDLQAQHRFVKVCQDAGAGNSEFRHVVIQQDGRPVCTATLSLMRVKLDLLAGPRIRTTTRRLRHRWPQFLELPILLVGLPVSFGQSCLRFDPHASLSKVLPLLNELIESVAAEWDASLIVAKEFTPFEEVDLAGLHDLGFFSAASLPGCTLPLRWNSCESYAGAMRADYRRQLLATLRQRHQRGLEVQVSDGLTSRCAIVHRLYGQVMDRAEFQLERLELSFFQRLAAAYGRDVRCITIEKDGEPLAAAVLLMGPQVAHFLIAGIDYEANRQEGAYLNLVTEVVHESIRSKVLFVEMGQTSYEIKQRLGAVPIPRHMYLRHRDPVWHRFLSKSACSLFPERMPLPRRVFATQGPGPWRSAP